MKYVFNFYTVKYVSRKKLKKIFQKIDQKTVQNFSLQFLVNSLCSYFKFKNKDRISVNLDEFYFFKNFGG